MSRTFLSTKYEVRTTNENNLNAETRWQGEEDL